MGEHGPVRHGKPHTGTLPHGFCGEKGLKDPVTDGIADPGPVIRDPDHAVPGIFIELGFLGREHLKRGQIGSFCNGNDDPAIGDGGIFHGIPCIDKDIEERLLDLHGVRIDAERCLLRHGRGIDLNGRSLAVIREEQFQRGADQFRRIKDRPGVCPFSCEPEHLFREGGCLSGNIIDLLQVTVHIFILHRVHIKDNIQVPLNGMEEVVEVVSDPACKPPDGLQTLVVFGADPPLFQFLFQTGAAGNVTPENDVLRFGILLCPERGKCEIQHPVRSGKSHRNGIRRFILPYFGRKSGEVLKILSIHHISELLSSMVCIEDRTFTIDDHNHIARPLEKQFITFFRPAQVFFQCLCFSEVTKECEHNIKRPSAGTRLFLIDPAEIDSGHDPDPDHCEHIGEVGFRQRTPPVIAAEVVDDHKEQTIKELYQSQRPDHGNDQTAVPVPEPLIQDRQQENIHRKRNHSCHHGPQRERQQFTECKRLFFAHGADQLFCQIRQIKIKDE